MRAVVVYESLWGNTARLARAVAQGLGSDTRTAAVADATLDLIAGAEILVLGAPVHSYGRPEFVTIQALREPGREPDERMGDIERHLMREWLAGLPADGPPTAVFEIRIGDLEGEGGASDVLAALEARNYPLVTPAESFRMERLPISSGPGAWVGPEELERARAWGAHLADLVGQ